MKGARFWHLTALAFLVTSGFALSQEPALPLPPIPSLDSKAAKLAESFSATEQPATVVELKAAPEPKAASEPVAPPAEFILPMLQPFGGKEAVINGPKGDDVPLSSSWKNALKFEHGEDFIMAIGGRVQFDTAEYITPRELRENVPGTNPLEDGVSFRRIRIDLGGTWYKTIDFYVQVDFANGLLTSATENRVANATYPTDMWMTFRDLPWVGNVRVGNQKPLYSFEHMVSSRFPNFMERSLGYDAFTEGFNNGFEPGITAFDTYADKRGTWAVGLFKATRSPFGWNFGQGEIEVNGRFTALPVWEDEGRQLVHIGVGMAHRDLDEDQARYRSRMDVRNSPSTLSPLLADTEVFNGTRQQMIVPELVAVDGPWSFQAEYYGSWVHNAALADTPTTSMGTAYFWSAYAEVHYFLTGEHRAYNRDQAVFTRVVPRTYARWNKSGFSGCGAWQVAARYSYLDLDSKGIQGGRVHDMTLGLNWFLNPNTKVQLNYSLAHREVVDPAGNGMIHAFGTRLAWDY